MRKFWVHDTTHGTLDNLFIYTELYKDILILQALYRHHSDSLFQ